MARAIDNAEVTLGEGVVVIRRKGVSAPVIANILGMDRDDAGEPARIYLDRLVHSPAEDTLGGWSVSGAISTILEAESPCGN